MTKKIISEKIEKCIHGYRIEYVMQRDDESYPAVRGIATLYQYSDVVNKVECLYTPRICADYIDCRADLRNLVLQGVGYECRDLRAVL